MATGTEGNSHCLSNQQALEIGARIKHEPSAKLVSTVFQAELNAQLPLFDALSRVDLAHTFVMVENGIIPEVEARNLIKALWHLRQCEDDFHPVAAIGDLYTNREAWLMQQTSSASWLGTGRARREAITTAYTIKLREELLILAEALIALMLTMLDRSQAHVADLMPDYTYLQQAQPTSFGHYLLGFAYPVLRDLQRIKNLYPRINLSPAGCGSSNGSRIPLSRERLADLLGFEGLVSHTRDAMWQADLQIEIVSILCAILINLDRLAEDLQIFTSEEFGLIELDDSHARASKIMPQKKNPFALTYIRGLANSMIGTLTTTAAIGRTPSGQPDNRLALYGLIPSALEQTQNAVSLISEVVALLQFNRDKARDGLDYGFLMSTDLAEVLVLECGIPFRDAHRLVGNLVRSSSIGGDFSGLTAESLVEFAETLLARRVNISDEQLKNALNPETSIASRSQTGGAAAMFEMIEQCRKEVEETNIWYKQCQNHLQLADQYMEQIITSYLDEKEER